VSDYRNTAGDRSFGRDIGVEPRTRPIASPQSTGMAEAFRSDEAASHSPFAAAGSFSSA